VGSVRDSSAGKDALLRDCFLTPFQKGILLSVEVVIMESGM